MTSDDGYGDDTFEDASETPQPKPAAGVAMTASLVSSNGLDSSNAYGDDTFEDATVGSNAHGDDTFEDATVGSVVTNKSKAGSSADLYADDTFETAQASNGYGDSDDGYGDDTFEEEVGEPGQQQMAR